MEIRRSFMITFSIIILILLSVSLTFLIRPSAVNAQSKNMQSIFLRIQQQPSDDHQFPFTIESYGATTSSNPNVVITAINAGANSIVDVGDDYVCLGSVQMGDSTQELMTVCIPYSAIVRVQTQNTLFE